MLTRREFLKDAAFCGAAGLAFPHLSCRSSEAIYDIVIRNGTVYNGTAAAPFVADVGIVGDRIVAVGHLAASGQATISARNCIVAPGFIDVHEHSDYLFQSLGDDREDARGNRCWMSNEAGLLQGVTTVVSGNCGYGFTDMDEYYAFIDSLPFAPNTCYLAPHGYLRQELFGIDTMDLTPDQLERLKTKVAQEMEKGALGMSTGLGYVPGVNASKEELIALSSVIKKYNGIYVSHIRNEPPSDYTNANVQIMAGILEAIDIGRQAGVPVQISHIKAYIGGAPAGDDAIGRAIGDARAEGIDVTADQYPFTASSMNLSVLAPPAFRTATGIKPQYWNDPEARQAIRDAVAETFLTLTTDKILITLWTGKRDYAYTSLQEIAAEEGKDAAEIYVEMVCGENPPAGIFFVIDEGALRQLMAKEYVFTGSDGCAVPEQASYGHPRTTSSFVKKLKVFALEEGVLSLQSALLSMTSRPAEKFGIRQRGKILPEYYADVCVFDPAALEAPATYLEPSVYSKGVRYVIVNGVIEVANGSVTGLRGGRALRRST